MRHGRISWLWCGLFADCLWLYLCFLLSWCNFTGWQSFVWRYGSVWNIQVVALLIIFIYQSLEIVLVAISCSLCSSPWTAFCLRPSSQRWLHYGRCIGKPLSSSGNCDLRGNRFIFDPAPLLALGIIAHTLGELDLIDLIIIIDFCLAVKLLVTAMAAGIETNSVVKLFVNSLLHGELFSVVLERVPLVCTSTLHWILLVKLNRYVNFLLRFQ